MNNPSIKSAIAGYRKYLPYGVITLLSVCLVALATVTFLPGPYRIDFFGVVAERTNDDSSVSIGLISVFSSLIVLPIVLAYLERFKNR